MPRSSSGFSGSGGRGSGGFSGGGYGGGGYHHHHHHYGGGFFFFPWHRPYYGGGLFSLLFLPIIILIFALIFLVSSIVTLISVVSQGGIVQFDKYEFSQKATAAYNEYFTPNSAGYEDNILIYFCTFEGYDQFYQEAVVGNNVRDEYLYMFDDGQLFEQSLTAALPAEDYNLSFDRNLYSAITKLKVEAQKYDSSFLKDPTREKKDPVLKVGDDNLKSEFPADGYTYEALTNFSDETGINVVMIIDDAESIFGRTIPPSIIISGVISLGICIFAGVWIYKSVKASKAAKKQKENQNNGTDYNDPRYWN